MSVLKEKIKAAQDVRSQKVTIPEWDVTIEVRTMTALDRAKLLKTCVEKDGSMITEKFQAGLIIASVFDPETGEKVFTDEDYELLMSKAAGVIESLATVSMGISGLTKDAMTAAEKNS